MAQGAATDFHAAAERFLAHRRIAVLGVSRSGQSPCNHIARKLEAAGHEVFAVNPHADAIDGRPCFHRLSSISGGIDAAVVGTHPRDTPAAVRQCAEEGVKAVWIHRGLGEGSGSAEAVRIGREAGIDVIAGGCPMMFLAPVDPFHACLRWFVGWRGSWKE